MDSPLAGIKVVDLSQAMAGPCCTMILGDFGADVIKIEPPETGDMLRFWGPPFQGGIGSYFLMFNRNKKGMTLNLKDQEAKNILFRMIKDADVVVESFRPNVKHKLKIDYDTLAPDNPKLIYTSISGFRPDPDRTPCGPGSTPSPRACPGSCPSPGPRNQAPPEWERPSAITLPAFSRPWARSWPCSTGKRPAGAKGSTLLCWRPWWAAWGVQASTYLATGVRPEPQGNFHPTQSPYGSFRTKDSYVMIAAGNQGMWERLAKCIGREELIKDQRFLTVADRGGEQACSGRVDRGKPGRADHLGMAG